jgi:hypothetical protein
LPVTSGILTAEAEGDPTVRLDGVVAVFDVSLELVDHPDRGARRLVFAFHGAADPGARPRPGAVTPVTLTGPDATLRDLGDFGRELLLRGIAGALVSEWKALNLVLAEVGLDTPDAETWLAPENSVYTYVEKVGSGGYLAVLSTTRKGDLGALAPIVTAGMAGHGAAMGFAISRDLFLDHVVMVRLPGLFGGDARAGDFVHRPGDSVTNTRPFGIRSIKVGAIWYTPVITALTVTVNGDTMTMRARGTCDLKAGIAMDFWTTSTYLVSFDPRAQSLTFTGAGTPASGHEVRYPAWEPGIDILVGPIVTEIMSIVIGLITDDLAWAIDGGLGASALARWLNQSVRWAGLRAARFTGAHLDDALYLSAASAENLSENRR